MWKRIHVWTYSNDKLKARHFYATKRFIDDLCTLIDGGVFNDVYKNICPPKLHANYLKSQKERLVTSSLWKLGLVKSEKSQFRTTLRSSGRHFQIYYRIYNYDKNYEIITCLYKNQIKIYNIELTIFKFFVTIIDLYIHTHIYIYVNHEEPLENHVLVNHVLVYIYILYIYTYNP